MCIFRFGFENYKICNASLASFLKRNDDFLLIIIINVYTNNNNVLWLCPTEVNGITVYFYILSSCILPLCVRDGKYLYTTKICVHIITYGQKEHFFYFILFLFVSLLCYHHGYYPARNIVIKHLNIPLVCKIGLVDVVWNSWGSRKWCWERK